MTNRILFACVFIFIAVPCFAQEKEDNPIDKALERCLDKNGSTAGSVDCIDKAYQAWDKELNRAYNELMGTLSAEAKQSLKAAQTEWIKYRDLEFKLTDSVYSSMQGTMYIPMHADHRMEIVKKRALELKGYLDLLKDN
jgi:uncharacterized protein YecT (DUF1311 family)